MVLSELEDYFIMIAQSAGLEEFGILEGVSIYPNPVSSIVSIDLSTLDNQLLELELLDLAGQVISHKSVSAGTIESFDISGLSKGMYQVRIIAGDATKTSRIVKI